MAGARVFFVPVPVLLFFGLGAVSAEETTAKLVADGKRHSRLGDGDKAIEAFSQALAAQPEQPTTFMLRGDEHARRRQIDRAIEDYSAALRLNADDVELLLRRARCYQALSMQGATLDDCNAALSLRPDDPLALSIRSRMLYEMRDFEGALRDAKKVVLFGEHWATANTAIGRISHAQRDYAQAIASYDRALTVDPQNEFALYWSSLACQYLDRKDEAVARVEELIRACPAQRGGYAKPWPFGREVTEADLAHGRAQLVQLLKDRPAMAPNVNLDDEICRWAIQKFAGEDVPGRILWYPDLPSGGSPAEHRPPQFGRPAHIRFSDREESLRGVFQGREFSQEEQWSFLAFELHNVQSHARGRELDALAMAGELTREGYVKETTRLEFHALQRTRAWYFDYFRPWAREHGIASNPSVWRIDLPLTFDEFLAAYTDKKSYPWDTYGEHYDQLIKWGKHDRAGAP